MVRHQSTSNFALVAHTGNSYACLSQSSLGPWVIDFGAIDHIAGNCSLISIFTTTNLPLINEIKNKILVYLYVLFVVTILNYLSHQFSALNDILHQTMCPHTPQQNGESNTKITILKLHVISLIKCHHLFLMIGYPTLPFSPFPSI